MRVITVLVALSLAGCASLGPTDPQALRGESDEELCRRYASIQTPVPGDFLVDEEARLEAIEAVLRDRNPDWDWGRIRDGKVYVGMPKTAIYCAWGPPDGVNRSSYGEQWVYHRGMTLESAAAQYLYVSGGELQGFNEFY
ncbi:MAG: hypothetical protein ACLFQ3_06620 [Thiohalorhabdus sp.]